MKILVVDGHPSRGSFVGALADEYVAGARGQGHEVEVLRTSGRSSGASWGSAG